MLLTVPSREGPLNGPHRIRAAIEGNGGGSSGGGRTIMVLVDRNGEGWSDAPSHGRHAERLEGRDRPRINVDAGRA